MGDFNKINSVPQKEADSKEDRLLLGFLHQEADRIQFGTIVMEFTVRAGRVDRIKSNEISRTFNIGGRDNA